MGVLGRDRMVSGAVALMPGHGELGLLTPEERAARARLIEPIIPAALPKVSLLIASYNNPTHLELCLESIYQQVYPNWEIVVSDDGSDTDDPRQLAIRYGASWITKPHDYEDADLLHPMPNIARMLNNGLSLCTGQIIQTLQQDHVLAPDFLLWLVRARCPGSLTWGLTDHRAQPFTLSEIQSMTRTVHYPDGEIRYNNHLNSGRRLLVEMSDWRNTDGLDCAFDNPALPLDESLEMVGQSHVWLDWVLQNVLARGTPMLINPMMRLWHMEHPERPDKEWWEAQIARSYAYMRRKYDTNIWSFVIRPLLADARGGRDSG